MNSSSKSVKAVSGTQEWADVAPVARSVMFTVCIAVGSKELAKRVMLDTRLSVAEDAAIKVIRF